MRLPPLSSLLLGAASLLLLPPSATAVTHHPEPQTTVSLWIPSSAILPNPRTLSATTHATLTALRSFHDAPLSTSGAFVFRNVTPGSYLADVHCGSHAFAPLRIDVVAADEALLVRAWETYRGNDWENKGPEVPRTAGGAAGFAMRALAPKEYYVERGSFSILGILKNPMILMGLVSMVLFIGMPKLVENMDPEMRAEFEEQQRKNPMNSIMGGGGGSGQGSGANPMGNFDMAAYLAGQGTGKKEEAPDNAGSVAKKGGRRKGE